MPREACVLVLPLHFELVSHSLARSSRPCVVPQETPRGFGAGRGMASCSFSGWVYVVKDVASRLEGQPVPSVSTGGSFSAGSATGSQVLPRFMALVQQTDQSCVLLYKRDPQSSPQEVSAFSPGRRLPWLLATRLPAFWSSHVQVHFFFSSAGLVSPCPGWSEQGNRELLLQQLAFAVKRCMLGLGLAHCLDCGCIRSPRSPQYNTTTVKATDTSD